MAEQTGLPASLIDRLPEDAADLEIIRSDELEAAQNGVDLLRKLVWVLLARTIGLYAIAIAIAGQRRDPLRAGGAGPAAVPLEPDAGDGAGLPVAALDEEELAAEKQRLLSAGSAS